MPTLFRLDEFARTADGAITDRDLTRFLSFGFDLDPDALVEGPTLLAPDRQTDYKPIWFLECAAFGRVLATRDHDVPRTTPGVPFVIGESEVGGEDLVGGGAGVAMQQAYARILNYPEITRATADPHFGLVETQTVTVVLANPYNELSGDYRAAPFTLTAYDAVSGFLLDVGAFIVAKITYDIGQVTIEGTNVDLAILDEMVPKGTITTAEFPLAAPDAIGKTPTWLFGNVTNLPLLNVRDGQVDSTFDHLVQFDDAAAMTGLRRVMPGGANPFIEMTYDELEPYPGMDGVGQNLGLEDWDAGVAVAPDGWALSGAGATIAKTITAGQFTKGSAAAAITVAAATTQLSQGISDIALPLVPLTWWQGRQITVAMDVRAAVGARVHVRVGDGVGNYDSTFHTGGGTFEPLTVGTVAVPCIIDAAATSVAIRLRIVAGAATTVYVDNVLIYLRAHNWAECLRPDLYAGYTAIRTFLRQEDANGALYQLVADVHGLQPERDMVRFLRTVLTHPTHSAGRTVDAASFDTGEIAASFTHEDAVRLDGPELFLPYRDVLDLLFATSNPILDRSGHERHGTLFPGAGFMFLSLNGAGGASDAYQDNTASSPQWTEVPSSPAFSGQAISLRTSISLAVGSLPFTTARPITEKLVGVNALSGYGFYRENNQLVFFVRGADTNLYTVVSPLVDVTDEERSIDVWGTAAGGALTLYRDGVLAATGSYTGAIAEGDGVVLVGKFGAGIATAGIDRYDNIEIVAHEMTAARIAAVYAAIPFDAEPVGGYDAAVVALSPTFYYKLAQEPGETVMFSTVGTNGSWVGGPTLGVRGPLTAERGHLNSGGAARFTNNVAQYGVKTGLTLANADFTLVAWVRPVARAGVGGICEKTIGGVRDTQWGLRQTNGSLCRFTLKATSGLHTFDAPILAEDVDRWTKLAVSVSTSTGSVRFAKNGIVVTSADAAFTGPLISGVGDFYIGVQGTNGGGLTRPFGGDIGDISYHPSAFADTDFADLWLAATWYNGGINVDAAMTTPRPLRVWLEQVCQMRGIRLGFTVDGTITVSVDAAAPTTIRMHARDGAGDGERTIKDIRQSTYPHLDQTDRDVVVLGRRDLLSGTPLITLRRPVSTRLDQQGRRIGRDKEIDLADVAREWPTLDRIASYLVELFKLERTVELELGQEARQLMEAELLQVTQALLGHNGDVMAATRVTKSLPQHTASAREWSDEPYTYVPEAFPSGAGPG